MCTGPNQKMRLTSIAAARCLATSRAADLAALLARLDGVNLAAGELLVHTLVGLAVLTETVVLCLGRVSLISSGWVG